MKLGAWRMALVVSGVAISLGARSLASPPAAADADPRNVRLGLPIPDENYCDQPYVVITRDGNWLCLLTTGVGHEGQRGQHVVATISSDQGRTWSPLIDIEPADGPEASWAMPLVVPSGRVYVFYCYNGDRVTGRRADMIGWYCFRYSDDHGRTWSERHRMPIRLTDADRRNDWQGEHQIFWGIGKPITVGDKYAIFAFTKIGKYMLDESEGWFFRSENILTESDPAKITWQLLPDGDKGLRNDAYGSIQSEQNLVALSGGSLYCIYRTTNGFPMHAYSHDGGRSWTIPEPATYTPDGRTIRHPRACPRIFRCENGNFLLWYHNHGGKDFNHRNPAFISGGVEIDGKIHWSQPEILLYDEKPDNRLSYPDLIEQNGRYWITETQKTEARVHEIDPSLLQGLWNQASRADVITEGRVMDLDASSGSPAEHVPMPPLPDLTRGPGFTIDLRMMLPDMRAGQMILDSRDDRGRGVALATAAGGAVALTISDGKTTSSWTSDAGAITPGRVHHVTAIVDSGPRIISFLIDGVMCDGAGERMFGWGRFEAMRSVNTNAPLRIAQPPAVAIEKLRIYDRPLRTSEAISNYRAAAGSKPHD